MKHLYSFFLALSVILLQFNLQAQGNNCSSATALGTLPAPAACPVENGTPLTTIGTTVGATAGSPYTYLVNCQGAPGNGDDMDAPAADVWYSFVASGTVLDVTITSAMSQMNVALWTGTCGSLTGAFCDVSPTGNLTTTFEPLSPGTTYYVQISGGSTTDVGAFSLTLENYQNCDICMISSNLTASPAPVNGYYAPNTTVTFCLTVNDWTNISNNWLHGVIPTLGNGWNLTTLNGTTSPPGCSNMGTDYVWMWLNSNTSTATGLTTGEGWYVDIDPNGPTPPNGVAGNNFGDACLNTTSGQFCWQVTTNASCTPGNDLSISVNTTADGESGSWNSPACQADPTPSFAATLLCCATLVNAGNDASICSNGSTSLSGSYSNTSGAVSTSWTASPAAALTGLSSTTSLNPTFTPPAGVTGPVTFTLSVTDQACTATDQVTITVNPLPTITGTLSRCDGLSTTLTGSGTPATTNPWTSSNTAVATVSSTGVVTAIDPGTTTITYTNSNGCQTSVTFTVFALPTISGTLSACVTNTSQLTGSGTAATTTPWVSSNTAIATVNSSGLVTAVAVGTTNITYTNSNGCQVIVTFTVNALPTISGTLSACITNTSQLTGSGTPSATIPWVSSNTAVATVNSSGLVTAVAVGSTNITYTNSNGCPVMVSFTVNPSPTVTGTLSACITNTSQLSGSGTPSATNPWTSSNGLVATVSSTGLVTAIAAGTTNITYTNSNGCAITVSFTVNALPTISGTLSACITNTSQLTGSGTPSTTTPWLSSNTSIATVSSTGLVTGVAAGTASITYTNNNGCQVTATFTVNALPTVSGTLSACFGNTSLLSGSGTPSTTNPWLSSNVSVATVNSSGLVSAVAAGSTNITYTNNSGCQVTVAFTVNALPTISGTLSACITNTSQLSGSGTPSTTTPWASSNNSIATVSSSGLVTGVSAGTVTITYTNNNGCQTTASFTVNPSPVISGNLSFCANATTLLSGTGTAASSNPWISSTVGVATVNSSGLVTGVTPGSTNITYTNSNGCQATVAVTVLSLPTALISGGGAYCQGVSANQISVAVTGNPIWTVNYTFNGTPSTVSGAASPINLGNSTGTYVLTSISDASCSNTASGMQVISVNPAPVITLNSVDPSSCNGTNGTITVNGSGSGSVAWSGVASGSQSGITLPFTINSLASGTYSVTFTSSATGCQSLPVNASLNNPGAPILAIINDTVRCGGSYVLPAIMGSSLSSPQYFTSPGGPSGGGTIVAPGTIFSAIGSTTLYAYDANGACFDEESFTITINSIPNATISGGGIYCSGTVPNNIQVSLTGVPNYNLNYTFNGTPLTIASNVASVSLGNVTGTYVLTSVSDANCSSPVSGTQTIVVNALPTATISGGGTVCSGNSPTAVSVALTGAANWTVNYTLNGTALTANSSSNTVSLGNSPGTYVLVGVTDNNCSNTANGSTTIIVNPLPTAVISGGGVYCTGNAPNAITVGLTGTPSWTVNYTLNGNPLSLTGNSSPISLGNLAGNYVLTSISDANCSNTVSGNQSIVLTPLPTATISGGATYCSGQPVSNILVNTTGTPNWTVNYNLNGVPQSVSGNTSPISLGNNPGVYVLTGITDAACSNVSSGSTTITVNPLPTAVINGGGTYCTGQSVGNIQVQLTGTPSWTVNYTLNGNAVTATGAGSPISLGNLPGTYNITSVTDALCSSTASGSQTIVVNSLPTASISGGGTFCQNQSITPVSVNVSGSPSWTINYTLNGTVSAMSGSSSPIVLGSAAGNYVVTGVSDANCTSLVNGFAEVVINPIPTASISGGAVYCENEPISNILVDVTGTSVWTVNYTLNGTPSSILATTSPISLGNLPGTYTLTGITDNFCSNNSSGSSTIVVNPAPNFTLTPQDPSACNLGDGSITLSGLNGNTAYAVTFFDDGNQVSLNLVTDATGQLVLNGLNAGNYSIFSITDNGTSCQSVDSTSLDLLNPGAPVIDDITDPTVCDSYTLPTISGPNVSGNQTFWTGPNASGLQLNPGDIITASDSVYIYDAIGSCSVQESFYVEVLLTPSITNPGDQQACGSFDLPIIQGVNLSGTENYYTASQAQGGTILNGPVTTNQSVFIYANNGVCFDEESFLVVVNDLPQVINLSGENEYCEGENISDILVEVGGVGPWTLNYTLNGSPQTITSSSSNINLGNQEGIYELDNLQDANCNDNVDGIQSIIVHPNPLAPEVSPDTTYCINWTPEPLSAVGSGGLITWYSDQNLTTQVDNIPVINIGTSTYYVTETSAEGCQGPYALVNITFENCDITIPTAFTPDNNEANDSWEIIDLDEVYKNNVVFIYNRWGTLLFQSEPGQYDKNPWDGTYQDKKLPVGSYYYIIDFNEADKAPVKGIVSIILNEK